MLDMNMTFVPSGDQAGELLVPRKRGQVTSRSVSIEYMQI